MYAVRQPQSNVFKVGRRTLVEERVLGKGAFGEVYKVREAGTSVGKYALKKIEVENDNIAVNMVKKEICILNKCSHDHIVRLYDVDTTQPPDVLILMEYCEGGNLNSRLARPSDSDTDLRWMKELADAMCYLHSKNIVHRDLKPENVLLTGNGSIKLGDFGLAREYAVLRQSNTFFTSDQALMSYLNTAVYMGTCAGTLYWMAPEVSDGHYTESADIFALGTIFYAILTRACMSAGGKKYYGAFVSIGGQKIGLGMAMARDRNAMVPLDGLSPSTARQVLRSMLDYNPKNRPSARNILGKIVSFKKPHSAHPIVNNFISPSRSPSPYLQAGPPLQIQPYPQLQMYPPPPVFPSPSPNIVNPQPMHGINVPMNVGYFPISQPPLLIGAPVTTPVAWAVPGMFIG